MARMPKVGERVTHYGEPGTVTGSFVDGRTGGGQMYRVRLDSGAEEECYYDELVPMSGGEFTRMEADEE